MDTVLYLVSCRFGCNFIRCVDFGGRIGGFEAQLSRWDVEETVFDGVKSLVDDCVHSVDYVVNKGLRHC